MKEKYRVGDKVKIVNYGHPIWWNKEQWKSMYESKQVNTEKPNYLLQEGDDIYFVDICPNLVGQYGIIVKREVVQGKPEYAIDGIEGKNAWYNEGQLEKI